VPLARVDDVHAELARRLEHLTVTRGSASLAQMSLPHLEHSQVPLQTCIQANFTEGPVHHLMGLMGSRTSFRSYPILST
jgi:hypothetical protein